MKILSLDGGGVRGVLQARLIQRLEHKVAFLDKIDRFAGASIGVVNATWLALGRDLDDLITLYRKAAPFIFGKPSSSIGFFAKTALRTQLRQHLGDARLRDLARPVLAGTLTTKGPHFFDPFTSPDRDELLVDVILAATAAVPLLPPHKGHVDGGVLANDPSAVALEWARTSRLDTALLSIGTGDGPPTHGGILRGLLGAVTAGQSIASETSCRSALGGRYHRAQPRLERAIDLNDAGALADLVLAANLWDETNTVAWIRYTLC